MVLNDEIKINKKKEITYFFFIVRNGLLIELTLLSNAEMLLIIYVFHSQSHFRKSEFFMKYSEIFKLLFHIIRAASYTKISLFNFYNTY